MGLSVSRGPLGFWHHFWQAAQTRWKPARREISPCEAASVQFHDQLQKVKRLGVGQQTG